MILRRTDEQPCKQTPTECVAIEKEIQKHPHQGSLGSRERTKREGETRQQDEKEVEKEYVAVEKDIQTPCARRVRANDPRSRAEPVLLPIGVGIHQCLHGPAGLAAPPQLGQNNSRFKP